MKNAILVAAALVMFSAHAETKMNFSGDAYVRGYFKNGTGVDHTQAFNQFFRLNADAQVDESLKIKTGLVLSSDTWEGDNHATTANSGNAVGGTNDNTYGNGSITHLDHALIEYTKNGWVTTLGRQVVSSPGNFLTADDRRDRIQVLKFFSMTDVLALVYDKRAEGTLANGRDDLDMYSINYYGSLGAFKYALQTGYWHSTKFVATSTNPVDLNEVKQFTPQLSTTLFGVNLDLYYTLLFGGKTYYKDDHHAAALKLSHDFEVVKVEYQSTITKNGGLVATGFDTLSNVVNNNPEHNQSHIALRSIGSGLGAKNADESLHVVRFSKTFFGDLTATLGAGIGQLNPSAFSTPNVKEKDTVLDASLKYDFSKQLALNAKYGKFFGDFKDHAGSLTLNANF
jgi:hypothetical protein